MIGTLWGVFSPRLMRIIEQAKRGDRDCQTAVFRYIMLHFEELVTLEGPQ